MSNKQEEWDGWTVVAGLIMAALALGLTAGVVATFVWAVSCAAKAGLS